MHITPWAIYLINLTDKIIATCFIGIALTILIGMVYLLFLQDIPYSAEISKKSRNTLKFSTFLIIFFIVVAVITPSSKTLTEMYVIPFVANNKLVQKTSENGLKSLNSFLIKLQKEEK